MQFQEIFPHHLPNGATLLFLRETSAPLVSIQYWIPTGSLHEGEWLGSGLSHLVEHLIFKGTATRNSTQLALEIQDIGGHLNAYTSYDRTVYHVDLPSHHVVKALDVLTDAILNPVFPANEFESEKDVIRREFAMGEDNPDNQFWKLALATTFSHHPIRHPIIGQLDLFNRLTREHVLSYFDKRYAPQNLTLVIVGDIVPETLIPHLEQTLGKAPRRLSPDISLAPEPRQIAPRQAKRHFPTDLARVAFLYPIPGFDHTDMPALELLAMLAGEGLSAWLHRSLVEDLGLAEEINAFTYAPCDIGVWGAEAYCLPHQQDELIPKLREILYQLASRPLSTHDLTRIKNQALAQHYHQLRTMHGQAAAIGQGWLLARDPALSYRYLQKLSTVTPDLIREVAQKYLHPDQENLVILTPAPSASTPSTFSKQTTTPQPHTAQSNAIFHPSPPHIRIPEPRLPLYGLHFTLLGALLSESPEQAGLARLTARSWIKSTQRRSAADLAQAVEFLGGHLHSTTGNNATTISIEGLSEHSQLLTELFAEILLEPEFKPEEIETEKRKQLAEIAAEMDNPLNVARKKSRALLYPDHPYARSPLGTAETVANFSPAHVVAFSSQLRSRTPWILALHGPTDLNPDLSWLSPLPTYPDPSSSPLHHLTPAPLTHSKTLHNYHEKDQAVLVLAFPTVPLTSPLKPIFDLTSEALSDLGSRLYQKIREELGLAYYVGASQFTGLTAGHFAFYLGTAPERLQEVLEILKNEITLLAEKGLSEAELQRSRSKLISLHTMEMQNASSIAHQATLNYLYGLGYDFHTRRIEQLESITLDSLNATVAEYLHPTRPYVTVSLSPLNPKNPLS
ncbi:MAG: pitrilysin family protein [Verrucomicrobiae bacterium]|nr:pitrilysin family protein [Verrucomicrobiae bacterium]